MSSFRGERRSARYPLRPQGTDRHHRRRKSPGTPDLVIEILSPGTRGKDLEVKRKIYARFGVQEYWIVDPDAATVEVLVWGESGYASAGVFTGTDRLSSPLLPELNLPLTEIFQK